MKYYAVTDDPRELYHYGVKGMKWGQHLFGPEPGLKKSQAYLNAQRKLKTLSIKAASATASSVKSVGSSIKRSAAQRNYNRQMKQQDKYAKAVEKAQRRTLAVEALHNYDQQDSYRKQLAREQKAARINEKLANVNADRNLKNLKRSVKSEKKLNKYMQQAREGTLRYGKLSEDQIHKLQERLSLENQARQLGGKEKQTWRAQKKEARRAGKLLGIQRGTAAIMEEAARGAAQFGIQGLRNRMMMKSASKHEGQYERVKQKAKNKKSERDLKKEAREDLRMEAYKAKIRDPEYHSFSTSDASAALKMIESKKEQKRLEDERNKLNNDLYRKLVLGDKQNPAIRSREEREALYEDIFGPTSTKKLNSSKKAPESKHPSNQLFENLNAPILTYAGVRHRVDTKDVYNGKELSKQDKKAIARNNKKWAREQRRAVSLMNRY